MKKLGKYTYRKKGAAPSASPLRGSCRAAGETEEVGDSPYATGQPLASPAGGAKRGSQGESTLADLLYPPPPSRFACHLPSKGKDLWLAPAAVAIPFRCSGKLIASPTPPALPSPYDQNSSCIYAHSVDFFALPAYNYIFVMKPHFQPVIWKGIFAWIRKNAE